VITTEMPFVLSKPERKLHDKIRKELLLEIETRAISKVENPVTMTAGIVKMLRLRQLTNSMELLGESEKSTKTELLKELLPTLLEGDRKAIIFSEFAGMCDILERELGEYRPLKITGEVKNRDDILKAFHKDYKHRVLIMSSAGQFGLNITAASVVIHFDNAWSISRMTQRTGRAHRIGQDNTVLEYHLLGKGTADMYVKRTLEKKRDLSDFMLGSADLVEALKYES